MKNDFTSFFRGRGEGHDFSVYFVGSYQSGQGGFMSIRPELASTLRFSSISILVNLDQDQIKIGFNSKISFISNLINSQTSSYFKLGLNFMCILNYFLCGIP